MNNINEIDRDILLYDFMESELVDAFILKRYNEVIPYITCAPKAEGFVGITPVSNKFSYKIEVSSDGLYNLTVYEEGYKTIDPVLLEMKEIGLNLIELELIIIDLSTFQRLDKLSNIIESRETERFIDCTLIGCITNKFITLVDYDDDLKLEEEDCYNLYFKNKSSDLFMVKAFNQNGMCYSGYTTASFGNLEIFRIKQLPKEFEYLPKSKKNNIKFTKKRDSDCFLIDNEIILEVDFDGGDNYYPSGFVSFNKDSKALCFNSKYKKDLVTYDEFKNIK